MLTIAPVPLPMAPLVGFAWGVVFAWLARAELARAGSALTASRPFAVALAFAALVYAPVVGYFAAFHADWAHLYWTRDEQLPSAVDLAWVLVSAASVPAGLAAAAKGARERGARVVATMATTPAALALILALVFAHRLALSGSTAQVRGGFGAVPIGASALGRGVVWGWLVLAAGSAWARWSCTPPAKA